MSSGSRRCTIKNKKLIPPTLVGQYPKMPLNVKDVESSDIISTLKQRNHIIDTVLPRVKNKTDGVNTYTVINGEVVDMASVGNLRPDTMSKSKNRVSQELKKLNMRKRLAEKLKNQSNL